MSVNDKCASMFKSMNNKGIIKKRKQDIANKTLPYFIRLFEKPC